MEPLTMDALRVLATAQGLDLSDAELSELLPVVEANRRMMASTAEMSLADVEPSSQYRIL